MILDETIPEQQIVIDYLRNNHESLYHVTLSENIQDISQHGLIPQRYGAGDNILRTEIFITCFCPLVGLGQIRGMLANRGELTTLRIDFENYITKDINFDFSHGIIYSVIQQNTLLEKFQMSLEQGYSITINETLNWNELIMQE